MSLETKYSDRLDAAQLIRTIRGTLEQLQTDALAGLKFNAQVSNNVRMVLEMPSETLESAEPREVNKGERAALDSSRQLYEQKLRCNVMQNADVDELMRRVDESTESTSNDIGPLVVVNGILLYRVPHSLDAQRGLFPQRSEDDGKIHASLLALNAGFVLKPTRCFPAGLSGQLPGVDFTICATDTFSAIDLGKHVYGFRLHKKELEYALARTDKGVTRNFSPDSIAGYEALYGK